jgi:RNA polymerase sigma-70 factor (ECF subfamily)
MTGATAPDFEAHRGYLTGLAYRMLGSVADAQDIVQDAYIRWHDAAPDGVRSPRAYLSQVVTRLCLDQLKSARRRRETYVGPWLPEPLLEDPALATDPDEPIAHDVSVALMLALERLSPLERAAFILKDVFDVGFDEIARSLDRDEAACRQLVARARAHIRQGRPRYEVAEDEGMRIAEAFFVASRQGDVAGLRDLLAENVVLRADGGGRKRSATRPLLGVDHVSRFFAGIAGKAERAGVSLTVWNRLMAINGMPGFVSVEADGTLQTTTLEISEGRIAAIYIMRNPDKLSHIQPLVPESVPYR